MVTLRISTAAALLAAFTASASPVGRQALQRLETATGLPLSPNAVHPPPQEELGRSIQRRTTPTGSSDNTNRCTKLELIWFRSADQPQGALGKLGEDIYPELLKHEPDTSVYNVVYNAAILEEFFTNKAAGAEATNWINRRAGECPQQLYMVGGYSKGALPVHILASGPEARNRTIATLTIGDPLHKRPELPFLASNNSWPTDPPRRKTLCNVNDRVCWPGGTDIEIHGFTHYQTQTLAAVRDFLIPLYDAAIKK